MPGKIQKGEFPKAAEFNRHVDASDYVHSRFLMGDGRPRQPAARDTSYVAVKNASGADRRQGEILEFTGLELTDLTHRQAMLTGNSPTLANGFGVLQSPLASNDFTPDCQVAGVTVALVNVTDTAHRYAQATASTYVLQSALFGPARILWKPSGTGEKTCAVILWPFDATRAFVGKADAAIALNATNGTVSEWDAGFAADLGNDFTGCHNYTADIASGDKVSGVVIGGIPVIAKLTC